MLAGLGGLQDIKAADSPILRLAPDVEQVAVCCKRIAAVVSGLIKVLIRDGQKFPGICVALCGLIHAPTRPVVTRIQDLGFFRGQNWSFIRGCLGSVVFRAWQHLCDSTTARRVREEKDIFEMM